MGEVIYADFQPYNEISHGYEYVNGPPGCGTSMCIKCGGYSPRTWMVYGERGWEHVSKCPRDVSENIIVKYISKFLEWIL